MIHVKERTRDSATQYTYLYRVFRVIYGFNNLPIFNPRGKTHYFVLSHSMFDQQRA